MKLSEKFRTISVKTELANKIEEFVKGHPEYGYRSISQFMEDAARKRLEQLEVLSPIPRFEIINHDENGVKLLDRQLHRVVDVYIKPVGIKCSECDSSDCVHVSYVLQQPDIQKLIRRKRKEGWKLPDV